MESNYSNKQASIGASISDSGLLVGCEVDYGGNINCRMRLIQVNSSLRDEGFMSPFPHLYHIFHILGIN